MTSESDAAYTHPFGETVGDRPCCNRRSPPEKRNREMNRSENGTEPTIWTAPYGVVKMLDKGERSCISRHALGTETVRSRA